jgi:hypothetical protein
MDASLPCHLLFEFALVTHCYLQARQGLVGGATLREELVVVGWTDPAGGRSHFGALLLGYCTDDGRLFSLPG